MKTIDIKVYMEGIGIAASNAAKILAKASTSTKNNALSNIASALESDRVNLLAANAKDMDNALANGLDAAMLDRLAGSVRPSVRPSASAVSAYVLRRKESTLVSGTLSGRRETCRLGRGER